MLSESAAREWMLSAARRWYTIATPTSVMCTCELTNHLPGRPYAASPRSPYETLLAPRGGGVARLAREARIPPARRSSSSTSTMQRPRSAAV